MQINELAEKLKEHRKIIVTGPPRSGTTISGLILSNVLGYKFIDESYYNGNDVCGFFYFLYNFNRNCVIQNTSFLRDIHTIIDIPKILVRRKTEEILESFENSKKFGFNNIGDPLFTCIDDRAEKVILDHYGYFGKTCVPEVIYEHFERYNKDYYEINYPEDIKDHEFFIEKEVRMANFSHMKQVNLDPQYLKKKGVITL